jgi:hypothetical protein
MRRDSAIVLVVTSVVAALLGAAPGPLAAEESQMVELTLPRPLARGDAVQLQVTTGPLRQGARLVVRSAAGDILGAVTAAPGLRGPRPNTATIPIAPSAIANGRVHLQLQLIEPRAPPRAPRSDEVQRLDLFVVPQPD